MVEWKKLGEVSGRNKGIPITAGQMSELASKDGNVRVFAAGSTIADIDESLLPKNCAHKLPSIIVKSRGYIDFEFYEKPFTHKNEMWSYSFDNKQEGKFIYYFLTTQTDFFRNKAKANSVKLPQLCVADTDNYLIPIPSLEEQTRIVGILDTFTSAIDNLKEQIAQRRKQYEYYRDQLLDLEGKPGVEMKPLGDIGEFIRGNGIQKNDFVEVGFSCIHYGQIHAQYGFSASKSISKIAESLYKRCKKAQKGDVVLATTSEDAEGVAKPFVWLGNEDAAVSGDAFVFHHNQNGKFIGHQFITHRFMQFKKKYATGAKVVRISGENMAKYKVALPPLDEQSRIVSILDSFEASIQNLEAQLEQRQKQYEYYRNKLLTFE